MKKVSAIELFLNPDGDLYRLPKNKYCYPMVKDSDRFKIVLYLAQHNGLQETRWILSGINSQNENKDDQAVRTDIKQIRKNIKKFLHIDGEKIIEKGRKGSGYHIHPNCKIRIIGS